MNFRIFMAPITRPGQVTLQADVETWLQVSYHLKSARMGGVSALIERQLGRDIADRTRVVRLTFADAQGRAILHACGLSA